MYSNRNARYAAVLLISLLWGAVLFSREEATAQPAPQEANPKSTPTAPERPIRIDVQLALVNVSVIDPYNRFVTGLEKEHFQVFEDDALQNISHFSTEDVPISI